MTTETIIYLVFLLIFLFGSFAFFIFMDLRSHKKQKYDKVKSEIKKKLSNKDKSDGKNKKEVTKS